MINFDDIYHHDLDIIHADLSAQKDRRKEQTTATTKWHTGPTLEQKFRRYLAAFDVATTRQISQR